MKLSFNYYNSGYLFPALYLADEELTLLASSTSLLNHTLKIGAQQNPFKLIGPQITTAPGFTANAALAPQDFEVLLNHLVFYKIIDTATKNTFLKNYTEQYNALSHIGKNAVDYKNQFTGPKYRKEIDHLNDLIQTTVSGDINFWARYWLNYFQTLQFDADIKKTMAFAQNTQREKKVTQLAQELTQTITQKIKENETAKFSDQLLQSNPHNVEKTLTLAQNTEHEKKTTPAVKKIAPTNTLQIKENVIPAADLNQQNPILSILSLEDLILSTYNQEIPDNETSLGALKKAIKIASQNSFLRPILIQAAFCATFGFFKENHAKLFFLKIYELDDLEKMQEHTLGYFDGGSDIFLLADELEKSKYRLFFHELTHFSIETQQQNQNANPFSRLDADKKKAWKEETLAFFNSLHSNNIDSNIFRLNGYLKSKHTSEIAARLAELLFFIEKSKNPKEKEFAQKLISLFASITANTFNYNKNYIELFGLSLISGFRDNDFFMRGNNLTLSAEDLQLINLANSKNIPILDAKIQQLIDRNLSSTQIIAELEQKGITPRALLQAAARQDNFPLVDNLLRLFNFAPVDITDALTEAAKFKHNTIVRFLIGKGANPFANSNHCNALHFAAFYGDIELTKLLLDHPAHCLSRDITGNTPLHYVAGQHLAIVRLLLAKDLGYASQQNSDEHFPVHAASMQPGNETVIAELVQAAPNISQDSKGRTPLHYLAQNDDANALKKLASFFQADINTQDQHGDTALHWAVKSNAMEASKILFTYVNCNPNILNKAGSTPLYFAIMSKQFALAELFLTNPALNIDTINLGKRTYLHAAALMGDIEVGKCLVARGAILEAIDNSGMMPLDLAVNAGHFAFAKFLITALIKAYEEYENGIIDISLKSLIESLGNSQSHKNILILPLLEFIAYSQSQPKVKILPDEINKVLIFATENNLQDLVKKIKSNLNMTNLQNATIPVDSTASSPLKPEIKVSQFMRYGHWKSATPTAEIEIVTNPIPTLPKDDAASFQS